MLNDLANVLNYILIKTDAYQLPQLYQELINLYNQIATGSPPPESSDKIIEVKQKIVDSQTEIEPQGWNHMMMKHWTFFNANDDLGIPAVKKFKSALSKYTNDPKGAANSAQGILNSLNELKNRTKNLVENLKFSPNEEKPPEGQDLLELVFDEGVAVDNLDQLSQQARKWEVVLKEFSSISKGGVEGKIFSINKGSPLVIILLAPIPVLKALKLTADLVLDSWRKYLEVKKVQKEIEKLDGEIALNKKKASIQSLEDGIDTLVENSIKKIVGELMEEFAKKITDKIERTEMEGRLKNGVERMFSFITNGGEVNVVVEANGDPASENVEERVKLAKVYVETKRLSQELGNPKLLDDKMNDIEEPNHITLTKESKASRIKSPQSKKG